MPAITASMVGELRAKTDAPMMECKKALTEADGDMTRAEEILRVKLGNKAGKAASRITAEGVVAAVVDGQHRCAGGDQLRDRLRLEERFVPGVRQGVRATGGCQEPGRPRRAVGAAAVAGRLRPDGRRRAQGLDRQDRREHVDSPLQALCRRRQARALPARHAHRRDGGVRGRRCSGQGRGDAVAASTKARRRGPPTPRAYRPNWSRTSASIAIAKAAESGKPPEIVAKMVEGSVQKYLKEVSLLTKLFVKAAMESRPSRRCSRRAGTHGEVLHPVRGRRGHREADG